MTLTDADLRLVLGKIYSDVGTFIVHEEHQRVRVSQRLYGLDLEISPQMVDKLLSDHPVICGQKIHMTVLENQPLKHLKRPAVLVVQSCRRVAFSRYVLVCEFL
jgi:hypothetical protein